MKPNWDDAPEWANYLAMDSDGNWFWHELEPRRSFTYGEWASDGRVGQSGKSILWSESLERRP